MAAGCEEHSGESYAEVIAALIDAGVDVNARDKEGATFLLKIVQSNLWLCVSTVR